MKSPEGNIGTESNFKKELIFNGTFDTGNLENGEVLIVKSNHHDYKIEKREDGLYVSGHEHYCPEPIKVEVFGSTPDGDTRQGWLQTGKNMRFFGNGNELTFLVKDIQSIERNP